MIFYTCLFVRCLPGFVLTGEETVKCREGAWNTQPQDWPVCAGMQHRDREGLLIVVTMFSYWVLSSNKSA